ncbi:hypothetical protein CALCODRAFT_558653 [Calocera cornea HHB12733]|uniref:Uncharacterized protein n=1 Tax=Calocera cornea HHB12733 TaxID=1353952 RepID=A0A165CTC3_9BASI|nr:hypothetical protein CALCODRAFT_558653 [Calocera cornea HHB12733]
MAAIVGRIRHGFRDDAACRLRMTVKILLPQAEVHVPLFFSGHPDSLKAIFSTTAFVLEEQHIGNNAWYCASCDNLCGISAFPKHPCQENILTVVTMYTQYDSRETGRETFQIAGCHQVLRTLKYGTQNGYLGFSGMWLLVSRHVISLALAQLTGGLQTRTIPLQWLLEDELLSPDIPEVNQILVRDLAARNGT